MNLLFKIPVRSISSEEFKAWQLIRRNNSCSETSTRALMNARRLEVGCFEGTSLNDLGQFNVIRRLRTSSPASQFHSLVNLCFHQKTRELQRVNINATSIATPIVSAAHINDYSSLLTLLILLRGICSTSRRPEPFPTLTQKLQKHQKFRASLQHIILRSEAGNERTGSRYTEWLSIYRLKMFNMFGAIGEERSKNCSTDAQHKNGGGIDGHGGNISASHCLARESVSKGATISRTSRTGKLEALVMHLGDQLLMTTESATKEPLTLPLCKTPSTIFQSDADCLTTTILAESTLLPLKTFQLTGRSSHIYDKTST